MLLAAGQLGNSEDPVVAADAGLEVVLEARTLEIMLDEAVERDEAIEDVEDDAVTKDARLEEAVLVETVLDNVDDVEPDCTNSPTTFTGFAAATRVPC